MKIITSKDQLKELASQLGVRDSWHEPDEQGVDVTVHGNSFDNAGFWPERAWGGHLEKHVVIKQDGQPVAAVNLASLFAYATDFEEVG